MKLSRLPAAVLLVFSLMMSAGQALAESARIGDLVIEQPWSRATPGAAKVGAGYLAIVNTGDNIRRLTAASSPVAERVEIHTMTMDGGVMRMRRLENGLELKPQEVTELKPGGYHLMLIGLKQPIKEGDKIPMQLTFGNAGKIDVLLVAAGIGARHAPGSTEIRPSGSHSGADAHGSSSGMPQGSASGQSSEHKGSH